MFRASIINKVSGCKSPDALKSGSIAANEPEIAEGRLKLTGTGNGKVD